MLFNSTVFVAFAAVFFALLPLIRRANLRYLFVIAASCVFFGWWGGRCVGLLALSGTIDFAAAWGMARAPRHERWLLFASVAGNLAILGTFKYAELAPVTSGGQCLCDV